MGLYEVEKVNGHIIQKVVNQKGELVRYQTVKDGFAGDTNAVHPTDTLTGARALAGYTLPKFVVENPTKPKSSYPQNQKGYNGGSSNRKQK